MGDRWPAFDDNREERTSREVGDWSAERLPGTDDRKYQSKQRSKVSRQSERPVNRHGEQQRKRTKQRKKAPQS
jgi:hypothetical protein